MKSFILKSALIVAALILSTSQASAQGLLKKVAKAANSVTQTTETTTAEATNDSATKKLNLDIPIYHVEVIVETDTNDTPLKNEDGTPKERYLLADQNGNYHSPEAVAAQHEIIRKCFKNILAKVGGGAAIGAVAGLASGKGLKGAAVGAAGGVVAGFALSATDIVKMKKQQQSLKEQEKLLDAYKQNITKEGIPVDAKADLSNIKDLAISKNETATKTKTLKELEDLFASEEFNNADASPWDIEEV